MGAIAEEQPEENQTIKEWITFEPTLLPYFFDGEGIHGTLTYEPSEDDIFIPEIWDDNSVADTEYLPWCKGRTAADHALYTRMFQLLEERLTN